MTAPTMFQRLLELDALLARHGFPPLSGWWRGEMRRFYAHGRAKTWTARVGRGGAKSTSLVKLALCETLFGAFRVPPGERHYFAFVSTNRDEASQRLNLIVSYLTALGIRYSRASDTIDLQDQPRGFKVLSATIAGVSGFRCFGVAGDEVAKWQSSDDSANPAAELVASMRAMTVTHPSARLAFFSSPLTNTDWHAKQIDLGDSDGQVVSTAPTWEANPTITEEQTRLLEPDERVWKREYAAIPQAAALAAFDELDVMRAFEPRSDITHHHQRVLVIDASSGRKDRFTYALAGWSKTPGAAALVLDHVEAFGAAELHEIGGEAAIAKIASFATSRSVRVAYGDQRESLMIRSAFNRHGVRFREMPWTVSSKPRGVARVRRWLLEGLLALPAHVQLRDELLSFEERVTPSGEFTFGARGSGHDDFVSLLITLALADEERKLIGSPILDRGPAVDSGGSGAARDNALGALPNIEELRLDTYGRIISQPVRSEYYFASNGKRTGGF